MLHAAGTPRAHIAERLGLDPAEVIAAVAIAKRAGQRLAQRDAA